MRWAIVGTGVISGVFADAIGRSADGELVAVGGRDPDRRAAFAAARGIPHSGDYDAVRARDDVDAVYIGTVHPAHAHLALAAIGAGKAVLCEKPLTPGSEATAEVIAAARRSGVPLIEAFKYRFSPLWQALRDVVVSGEIGEVVAVDAAFGFAAPRRTGRLFDPATAGGAILDVGCYPVSLAVGIAGWTAGSDMPRAVVESAGGQVGDTGVDESAHAVLSLGSLTATVRTSITEDLPRSSVIRGTHGAIEIANVWGSRTSSDVEAIVRAEGGSARIVTASRVDQMAAEADALAAAARDGRLEAPEMPWRESLVIARLLEEWRARIS